MQSTEWCQVKKDFATVMASGTKTHEQKRLIFSNLKEVYIHI